MRFLTITLAVVLIVVWSRLHLTAATSHSKNTTSLQDPSNGNLIAELPFASTKLDTFLSRQGRRLLTTLWNSNRSDKETFVGRCLGVARKLKLMMPLIIAKLAVILTVLLFLTLFSVKGLGLLFGLLAFNLSGAVAKLAIFFSHKKDHHQHSAAAPPQTQVHFHIHRDKYGEYQVDHGHGAHDWLDRRRQDSSVANYDLYDRLRRDPYMAYATDLDSRR